MFVKVRYCFLVHSLLSTLSVFGFLTFPTVISAHPSFGSQCSTCHPSANEDTTAFESTTEENTTAATTEEDTTTPTTAVDTVVPTPTIPPTTKEDVVIPTPEENTATLTTVLGNKNVAQFITPFDLNGEGQITQDEVQALQSELFDQADTNADGFLSNEEWQVAKKTPKISLVGYNELSCGADFNRLDNNKDGLISKEEFVNNVPLFDQFDLDNNGIITAKELTTKKPRHPWMSHRKLYNNWIRSEMSYKEIGHKKKGNFIRYYQ